MCLLALKHFCIDRRPVPASAATSINRIAVDFALFLMFIFVVQYGICIHKSCPFNFNGDFLWRMFMQGILLAMAEGGKI